MNVEWSEKFDHNYELLLQGNRNDCHKFCHKLISSRKYTYNSNCSKFYSTYCFKLRGLNIHKRLCNRAIAEIHMCLVLPDHFRNQVEDKLNQSCLKFKIYKEKYFIHIRYSTSQKKNCQEEKQPEKQLSSMSNNFILLHTFW